MDPLGTKRAINGHNKKIIEGRMLVVEVGYQTRIVSLAAIFQDYLCSRGEEIMTC